MRLLRLQAAGKIPGPAPVAVMERILKKIETQGHLHLKVRQNGGKVNVWAASTNDNYVVGLKSNLIKAVAVIDTVDNNCYDPVQLKVDHAQNVWAGCEFNRSQNNGAVSEWDSAGNAVASYTVGCPNGWAGCNGQFSSYDTYSCAADANHVFASVLYAYGYDCASSCVYVAGAGVEWWPAGQPSATPTFDMLPYGNPVYNVYYMDEDGAGNLWVSFYGNYNSESGIGLGEIKNPTTPSWSFSVIENPGTYECGGGVYVSNGGKTLNVTDPCSRETYQYSLPLSTGSAPINVLGPTKANAFGYGAPISGGFNANDSKLILGDSAGWLDTGIVSKNSWKAKASPNAVLPFGAAFTPSDK